MGRERQTKGGVGGGWEEQVLPGSPGALWGHCGVVCTPPGQIIQTLDTDEAGAIEEAHSGEWPPGPTSVQLVDGLVLVEEALREEKWAAGPRDVIPRMQGGDRQVSRALRCGVPVRALLPPGPLTYSH